ncbi:MAG: hypothetical protein LW833_03685 [Hyphomicrobiales bacterium]|nr:hypothetical protein [Hyphomicrobiales bacterium]
MSVLKCLMAKVKAGLVSADLAQPLVETISRLEKELAAESKGRDILRAQLAETADAEMKAALREADLAVRQIEKQLQLLREMERGEQIYEQRYKDGKAPFSFSRTLLGSDKESPPIYHIMAAKLDNDRLELMPGVRSVFYASENLRGQAHARMRETIERLRPTFAGLKRSAVAEFEALEAAFDPNAKVSPEAKAAARGVADAIEFLREAFNSHGGNIARRENYVPNPAHNTLKVGSAGEEGWVAFVKPRLDRDQMLDWNTGQKLGPNQLDRLLRDVYRTIATDGKKDGPTSAAQGLGALAKRHAEQRVLHFKDATAWIEYDEKFGTGRGIFETWMDHIENMAHDAATLEVLGPNPRLMQRYMLSLIDQWALKKVATGENGQEGKALRQNTARRDEARIAKARLNALFAEIDSSNRVPVSLKAAHYASIVRDVLTAARMGSALLSSFVDTGSAIMRLNFNGLPGSRYIADVAAGMANKELELTAAQMGFVADSAAMLVRQNDRYGGETIRTGFFSRMSNAVITASGLRRWTEVHRKVFGMQIMAQTANMRGRAFDELDPAFRAMFERNGMGRKEWDMIRSVEPGQYGNLSGEFITGNEVRAIDSREAGRVADLFQDAINREMDFGVLDYSPETRSIIVGESKPGTLVGELRRFGGQFKSYPINQVMRLMSTIGAQGADASRLGWGVQTFLVMTALGMLSMQAKEIAKGRDPVTMDPTDPKGGRAWAAAVLQGGGLGVFGDFVFQDQTRQGNSYAAILAGPAFGALEKTFGDFLMANVQRAWKGEPTHFAGDALYAAAGLIPGSNLWYARAAFERGVVDQLALMIDERTPQRFERIEREAQKNWGQSFWWEPGRVEPRRSPNIGAAFGGGP